MSDKLFSGSIEVIYGPMFSGKSTELLRRVKRNTIAQKKCLLINYAKDNRYSNENVVSTHDKQMMKAMKVNIIEEAVPYFKDYDVIAIDEGQFFSDVVEFAEYFANNGKIVIVAALDATFQRKPFDVIGLLPIAEKITKLTAVCVVCSADAPFTQRLSGGSQVELIGGTELYRPVCRKCFLQSSPPEEQLKMLGKNSKAFEAGQRQARSDEENTSESSENSTLDANSEEEK